jgi:hypothetical protein
MTQGLAFVALPVSSALRATRLPTVGNRQREVGDRSRRLLGPRCGCDRRSAADAATGYHQLITVA